MTDSVLKIIPTFTIINSSNISISISGLYFNTDWPDFSFWIGFDADDANLGNGVN